MRYEPPLMPCPLYSMFLAFSITVAAMVLSLFLAFDASNLEARLYELLVGGFDCSRIPLMLG